VQFIIFDKGKLKYKYHSQQVYMHAGSDQKLNKHHLFSILRAVLPGVIADHNISTTVKPKDLNYSVFLSHKQQLTNVRQYPTSLSFILIVTFAGFLFCKKAEESGQKPGAASMTPKALSVETLVAAPQALSADIKVPGTVIANESTEIHPEVSGRMVELHIREGPGHLTCKAL
jgi:hypothetical protein